MGNELVKSIMHFEGQNLTIVWFKGIRYWIAREIGSLMGYADNGGRLIEQLNKDWADEAIEGKDFIKLTGAELKEFKRIMQLPTKNVVSSKHTRNLILLTESGVHLCCIKSNKPVGKRLRRHLVDEVMPQLALDGNYLPGLNAEHDVQSKENRLVQSEIRKALEFFKPLVDRLYASEDDKLSMLIEITKNLDYHKSMKKVKELSEKCGGISPKKIKKIKTKDSDPEGSQTIMSFETTVTIKYKSSGNDDKN